MATRIGCDNLVYALMTVEETTTSLPTYGTIKRAPGVIKISVNPNPSQETLFADDGPMETAATLGKIDVEIDKAQLTTENKADLLGHNIDSKGGLAFADNDIAPYVAIAFRSLKSNGKYKYVWMYKGQFTEPEDMNETKGDTVSFQTDTIKGQFVRLNYEQLINGAKKRHWKYEIDGDYSGADATLMSTWFDEVKYPTA